MTQDALTVTVHASLDDIAPETWDACACPEAAGGGRPLDPFTTHRFLLALERSGSVGPGTGWLPQYLTVQQDGEVIACAPLYAKGHSQGEYVFDYAWADAYERAGGRYYPKLQIAAPFTPVTGRRFLTRPGAEMAGTAALLQGATELAQRQGASSVHATFCTDAEAERAKAMGLLRRRAQQYHWENRDYANFDAFLADLSSRKRKTIRKERRTAQAFGGTIRQVTGAEITPAHWDAMWTFYQNTGARKWGSPYLTRAFFDIAHDTLRDDILLVLAERDGQPVAGALNMIGRDRMFGRYWGCSEHHPCLHFELCYYQAIDTAIAWGLDTVEAGAQGEHKIARGYLPTPCHSVHWIADEGFARAVAEFLEAERAAIDENIEVLTAFGPFRQVPRDEHD